VTDDEITDLLFIREEPARADLAMVFGAAREDESARRTRRGVQLYQEGLVPKLLVTGGGMLAMTNPEALRMADLARQLGVFEMDLLVEPRSSTTFANVHLSLALLREVGLADGISTVILISSEWHMRRVLLTAKSAFPVGWRFVCCPPVEGCTRENWTTSEEYRQEVHQELVLLKTFQEAGLI